MKKVLAWTHQEWEKRYKNCLFTINRRGGEKRLFKLAEVTKSDTGSPQFRGFLFTDTAWVPYVVTSREKINLAPIKSGLYKVGDSIRCCSRAPIRSVLKGTTESTTNVVDVLTNRRTSIDHPEVANGILVDKKCYKSLKEARESSSKGEVLSDNYAYVRIKNKEHIFYRKRLVATILRNSVMWESDEDEELAKLHFKKGELVI